MVSTTPLNRRAAQQPKGDERQRLLLKAAKELLEAGEFEHASVAELASAAGVSRPTFYFYFESKDALLASVIDATQSEIATALDDALQEPGSPLRRLELAIAAVAEAWWEQRATMSAAISMAAKMPALEERMVSAMAGVNARCVELVLAHGAVPERNDRAAAERLVATLALMNERAFSHSFASARRREDLVEVQQRLLVIWQRALGLPAE